LLQTRAALAIRNSHHFAALWPDIEPFAVEGFIVLAMVNGRQRMAVWGGNRKLFGTSPMAFACPRPGRLPLVWDQASSVMAQGEILLAAQRGHMLPEVVGLDADGRPTTNPQAVLDGGSILPFGGHKGSSIAFMIEIIAGALTGGPFGFEDRSHKYPGAQTPKAGQTVILIDPLLVPGNRYFERIEALFEAVVASGVERLPAERRYARRQQSLRDGITVSGSRLGGPPRAACLTYRRSPSLAQHNFGRLADHFILGSLTNGIECRARLDPADLNRRCRAAEHRHGSAAKYRSVSDAGDA
jgi:delta1-piperideine-2-carboxylate reductase